MIGNVRFTITQLKITHAWCIMICHAWRTNHDRVSSLVKHDTSTTNNIDIKHEEDWCQPRSSVISILIKMASSTMFKHDINHDQLERFYACMTTMRKRVVLLFLLHRRWSPIIVDKLLLICKAGFICQHFVMGEHIMYRFLVMILGPSRSWVEALCQSMAWEC